MVNMRAIAPHILADLKKKMVFIGGPRQVGKTYLAQAILTGHYPEGRYFNWDFDEDRHDILAKKWRNDQPLLIFDELHKFPRWKNWLKGIYDVAVGRHAIMVTGSARLDLYRRGGDSMMGRYHYWRLHPFTLDEIPAPLDGPQALKRLMAVGGFPEPFLDGDEREARRWRRERFDRVIREDVRDLESVRNLQLLALFVDLLRRRVGSPVVLSNLAADLQIAPKTAAAWLALLERMYIVFVVRPYSRALPRAIVKPPKVYFFDNADVIGDEGARFENLVATTLLKRLHFLEDRDGDTWTLAYLRDKQGHEVDFAVIREDRIASLVEAKYGDETISGSLRYFAERLNPPNAVQIVANLRRCYDSGRIRVVDPLAYCGSGFFGQA